ncbi:TonB-dependent receptor [Pelagicoccus sp. SDUM812005]|uniref:TonB-dependent receptor n=1 Tax=Pelagicoccus sp. SDUM812005 TaxID=3041257 RepID=UPI0028103755|nr:TonB-dependent receptor [Pelagicoccus sp. SDUM812005]MDQ8181535.1 TonB-dependent receptor [Pelagicoccus sp. SDUM812005]
MKYKNAPTTLTSVTRSSAAALLLLGLATAPVSHSQEDDEEVFTLEAFKVTGSFAGSLAAAAQEKKFKPTIVEAISAEDIGKLPDTSIAESLARLPGMTSQRVNGRSQVISIRGFPSEFTTGLLNGRELATTSNNRDIEYDQFPAELLSGATVYKTTEAALATQGISGTVNLQTVRPLSHGKKTVATNVFYEWTDKGALNAGSDDAGIRFTGTYIDQLQEGKAGIAFGFSHTDKPGQGEQWQAWGYPSGDTDEYGNISIIGGAKPFVRSSSLERDSFMFVYENKLAENVHSTFDAFYSNFAETQMLRGIELPLWWSSAQFRDGSEVVDDGFVVEGIYDNVYGVVRNDIASRDADVYAFGWNLEFANLGDWTADADIAYSKVDRVDTVLETYSGTGSNQSGTPDSIAFNMSGGTGAIFTPTIDYTDPSNLVLSSPQGWGGNIVPGGQLGYLKEPQTEDELLQIKLGAKRGLENKTFSSLQVGLRYTDRSKSEAEVGKFLALPGGATEAPLPSVIGTTDLSFIGIEGMASYDPIAALDAGTYQVINNPNADVVAVDWNVDEQITQLYTQLDIDTRIGDTPVTGAVGFQYIFSEQSSSGLAASGEGDAVETLPVTNTHSYEDFVPSLNLNFLLPQDQYLRFSAARQIMRQRMSDMRAGYQFSYTPARANISDPIDGPWGGSGGNTALEPWRANAIDLSYEKYFKDGMGYWSAALFYKDLRTFAYKQKQIRDFTGFPYEGDEPATFLGGVEVPQNGSGGSVQGLELTLSLPGEKLSDSLKGFGAILNAAFTDNNVQPDPNDANTPLPGFSDKVASATFYYESENGFSARVSGRYRSEYRANVASFGPRGEDFRTVQDETVIDGQVSYTFQSGALEGASLILQGYNLNDEPLVTYDGTDPRFVRDYQSYGPSYSIGMSYKF